MTTPPKPKANQDVRAFLAEIGHRGGLVSRRELTRKQAKQMVAIREAKRAAIKKGDTAWARKRIPLPQEQEKSVRHLPAAYPRRWIGNVQ